MFVKHTKEAKAKAIAMQREGTTISTISKELYVAESTLYHWFKAYESPQSIDNELVTKEVEKLAAECQHLQGMIDIIRQSGYIITTPFLRTLSSKKRSCIRCPYCTFMQTTKTLGFKAFPIVFSFR